jgi:hypothetical protein
MSAVVNSEPDCCILLQIRDDLVQSIATRRGIVALEAAILTWNVYSLMTKGTHETQYSIKINGVV